MSIGELCKRAVVVATRYETARNVARRMKEYGVGTVVVVDEKPGAGRRPVGIVTDRDLVLRVLAVPGIDADACIVGSIMSPHLMSASEGEDVDPVITRMRENGIRRMPVVNRGGGLEGIIAYDDLFAFLVEREAGLARVVHNEEVSERRRLSTSSTGPASGY